MAAQQAAGLTNGEFQLSEGTRLHGIGEGRKHHFLLLATLGELDKCIGGTFHEQLINIRFLKEFFYFVIGDKVNT